MTDDVIRTRAGELRHQLKAAHEGLNAAQPQCVIVASRFQLQQALDIINYVAAQEGVEPGDTFAALPDVPAQVLDSRTDAILADRLAEALRLTAEWAMATALPGWSWFDALQEYRDVRGWDPLVATGLPCGVTPDEATEPVWSLSHILSVLDDPFPREADRAKAMRMLRWHEARENDAGATADYPTEVVRDLPALADEAGAVRGVPFLLEQLGTLACESVYLWFNPRPGYESWHVWTGAPAGTGGGEWGAGATARDALGDAYRRLMAAIFDGRLVR